MNNLEKFFNSDNKFKKHLSNPDLVIIDLIDQLEDTFTNEPLTFYRYHELVDTFDENKFYNFGKPCSKFDIFDSISNSKTIQQFLKMHNKKIYYKTFRKEIDKCYPKVFYTFLTDTELAIWDLMK